MTAFHNYSFLKLSFLFYLCTVISDALFSKMLGVLLCIYLWILTSEYFSEILHLRKYLCLYPLLLRSSVFLEFFGPLGLEKCVAFVLFHYMDSSTKSLMPSLFLYCLHVQAIFEWFVISFCYFAVSMLNSEFYVMFVTENNFYFPLRLQVEWCGNQWN